ncbi:MAG: hypothetical protein JJU34_09675 [Lunatimonas sp.]|uniref:hypothetical protein n=1 Tax=Lunatimonas sp. TaxID=2060141 RepID=UPI00263A6BF2|nr:hypothetical protein [Lunatimonas sp.]MCC5937541.1 hypothetical protein [Lunatimonas sp.]
MNVYLDLNIFDRIEKKDKLSEIEKELYSELYNLITEGKIAVPYSNAHLNDLFRGFQKNPNYIEGHIENIERLTRNLCICQYWGRKEITWHFREIREFFNEKQSEWEFEASSFLDLINFEDFGDLNPLEMFKLIPLPIEWKLAYSQDPMFGIMYPKSRTENNYLALMEDIYDFQSKLKSDYSLYKTFKAYLIRSMSKLQSNKEMLKTIQSNFKDLPKHLDIFEISNLYEPKSSENPIYQKVVETFYKYDLKGYKSDGNFNNMFDDSLHTFYAAHCEFFITNDDRCKYKAEKTYERLGLETVVIKADQLDILKKSL